MINAYLIIMVGLLILFLYSTRKVKVAESHLLIPIRNVMYGASGTVIANMLYLGSDNRLLSTMGFCLFSASIDWLLIALLRFVVGYIGRGPVKTRIRYFYIGWAAFESVSFLLNIKLEHVFTMQRVRVLNRYDIYEAMDFSLLYYVHLAFSYLLVIRILYLLIKSSLKSSLIYRRKYTGVLNLFLVVILLDAVSVFFKLSPNPSIIFYGALCIALYRYAFYYIPVKLVSQMKDLVMERMDSGIICFDEVGKCVYSNNQFWKMLGKEKNEINAEVTYRQTGMKEKIFDSDYSTWMEIHQVNGEDRYIEFTSQKMHDSGNCFVGCYYLIDDRTEEQREFEEKIKREKSVNEKKTAFLSQVSHEIRTPVNAIYGMNEMILRESNQENVLQYANHVQNATDTLIGLINDILDFSKIEAGRMEIINREYDVSKMLKTVCSMIRIKANEKNLEFVVEVGENLPSGLCGDDVRIRQILVNLLSNAVKYTVEGTVTLAVNWETTQEGGFLNVKVKDTGIGIHKEDMPRLFDAYARIEENRNHNIQGTGLGLSITKQLVEMMQGEIKVDSIYGIGSVFSCRIPQTITNATPFEFTEENIRETPQDNQPEFIAPDSKVLVVDDNNVNRIVFRNLLKRTKLQISEAESGQECLEKIKKEQFDLIFMDHMMPEMDGVQTFERMQKEEHLCKGVPVIMLTANAVEGKKEEFLKAGFSDFLSKPVDSGKLEKMIKKYLQI